MRRGICAALLAFAGSRPAAAEERPLYYSYAVQAGLGSHYGLAGGAFTWRFDPRFAAVVGAGIWGGAAGARWYPYGPLFAQVGVSPLAGTKDGDLTLYGPDLMAGVDLRRTRVSFTAGVGYGFVPRTGGEIASPTIDLGVGVNFGARRGAADAPPPPEEETP